MATESIAEKIRERFSSAAATYDQLSAIHREIGILLIGRVARGAMPRRVLDLGMGTGYLTERIALTFPDAFVVGVDAALGMARFASLHRRDIHTVCADAGTLPIKKGSMDMIISNLALQWAVDLDAVFRSCREALGEDGRMVATVFGGGTFRELFAAIEKTALRPGLTLERLADFEIIRGATEKCFGPGSILTREERRVEFPSMKDLLRWVKGLGANALGPDVFIGKEHLRRAEEYYQRYFSSDKGVFATLETIWLDARR